MEIPKDNTFKRLCKVRGVLEDISSSRSDAPGNAYSEFEFPIGNSAQILEHCARKSV
jgi:hypothetical protein